VIPNFLECDEYKKRDLPDLRARLCPPDRYDKLIIHLSNFRPVKRVDAVVDIFERVRRSRSIWERARRQGSPPEEC
jgi:glycosyltransferase involved in cell wall biosynthesis